MIRYDELADLRAVAEAGRQLRATAPVDDEFPRLMGEFDLALGRYLVRKQKGEYLTDCPVEARCDEQFLDEVRREVNRARVKFPMPTMTCIALGEEVGELHKAVLEESPARVWSEAVQVACMALRVARDGDPSTDDYRSACGLDSLGGMPA